MSYKIPCLKILIQRDGFFNFEGSFISDPVPNCNIYVVIHISADHVLFHSSQLNYGVVCWLRRNHFQCNPHFKIKKVVLKLFHEYSPCSNLRLYCAEIEKRLIFEAYCNFIFCRIVHQSKISRLSFSSSSN